MPAQKTSLIILFLILVSPSHVLAFPRFIEHVINPTAGTGLAIAATDINGDAKTDVVGASDKSVYWYQNPSFEPHLIVDTIKNSNVCVAPFDLDGDGIPEIALGADWQFNNTESGGALYLLKSRGDLSRPWDIITLLGEEPTLHRIRWANVDADARPELVVAPLKGVHSTPPNFDDTPARLFLLRPPNDLLEKWARESIDETCHVTHNIWPLEREKQTDAILSASYEGINEFSRSPDGIWTKTLLVPGNLEPVPRAGAGEVKTNSDATMLATIEPWHGNQAVVYIKDNGTWTRYVVDDTLMGGHAVGWADFDKDGLDELLVGFREKAGPDQRPGLNIYDLVVDGPKLSAEKYVIDDGGMATEDAVVADFNNDGAPDIAAFGRATHNIKWYENMRGE